LTNTELFEERKISGIFALLSYLTRTFLGNFNEDSEDINL
jgi:hypothetical protein